MPHLKDLFLKSSLLSFVTFLSFSLVIVDVGAISFGSYKAVSTRKVDQKRTVGSGSRSPVCQTDWQKDSLTLLIPEDEVIHYTTSSNPTFYVYARQTSADPLVFNIVSPEANSDGTPLFEKKIIINKLGVNKISVPPSVSLKTNQLYLWQVMFPCQENSTSVAKIVKGAVEKIAPSDQLLEELNNANSSIEKAKIYAHNGIWYEGIQLSLDNKDLSFFNLLLEEANLANIN